jgi:dTDP-4-amino-4,6-dideoxygalactose transaminase
VALFEEEFAKYEGAKYGVSCGNGTDALVLGLRALGIGEGDEVITTGFTFFATAESIAVVGAKPVFCDIGLDTYCIDPSVIEDKITKNTKAIIAVHFYGHSCDMDALWDICNKYNIKLITDCAQSAGTEYKGSRKNTLGDVSCFSFFPTKVLGCDGDGGMVLTNDLDVAKACRSLKAHGSGADGLDTLERLYKIQGKEIPDSMPRGTTKYYNYLVGHNTRLDAIQAAILRVKLRYMDSFIKRRRYNAELYNVALKDTGYITPYEADYSKHAYYLYVLRHENAQKIMTKLHEKMIQCGTYYPVPMHLQGAFDYLGYKEGDFPNAELASKNTFAIPVYPELSDEERNYIIHTLLEVEE